MGARTAPTSFGLMTNNQTGRFSVLDEHLQWGQRHSQARVPGSLFGIDKAHQRINEHQFGMDPFDRLQQKIKVIWEAEWTLKGIPCSSIGVQNGANRDDAAQVSSGPLESRHNGISQSIIGNNQHDARSTRKPSCAIGHCVTRTDTRSQIESQHRFAQASITIERGQLPQRETALPQPAKFFCLHIGEQRPH
jgi:hypothetical protein